MVPKSSILRGIFGHKGIAYRAFVGVNRECLPLPLFAFCRDQAVETTGRAVSMTFDEAAGQPYPLAWSSVFPFALLRRALPKQRGEPGAVAVRQRQQGGGESVEVRRGKWFRRVGATCGATAGRTCRNALIISVFEGGPGVRHARGHRFKSCSAHFPLESRPQQFSPAAPTRRRGRVPSSTFSRTETWCKSSTTCSGRIRSCSIRNPGPPTARGRGNCCHRPLARRPHGGRQRLLLPTAPRVVTAPPWRTAAGARRSRPAPPWPAA
jgi:hypothetical protein